MGVGEGVVVGGGGLWWMRNRGWRGSGCGRRGVVVDEE